jgi:hypothetical protein
MQYKCYLTILLLTLFIFPSTNIFSQKLETKLNIVGLWQENDSLLTAGLQNVYRFYPNGKFRFTVSSYDYLARLNSLYGNYKIKNNVLYLEVISAKEFVDGEITYGDEADYNDWAYKGSKEKITKFKIPKVFDLEIKVCQNNSDIKCIRLNYLKFYKISSNPDAYNK